GVLNRDWKLIQREQVLGELFAGGIQTELYLSQIFFNEHLGLMLTVYKEHCDQQNREGAHHSKESPENRNSFRIPFSVDFLHIILPPFRINLYTYLYHSTPRFFNQDIFGRFDLCSAGLRAIILQKTAVTASERHLSQRPGNMPQMPWPVVFFLQQQKPHYQYGFCGEQSD
ncbi:MAG: hypothetical protein MJ118_01560, partial [Clostridia bacterium]|nr:hypothetical protein [Clostridia bacterium]